VVRKTVKSLNDDQLLKIAEFVDHILIREESQATEER